LFWAFTRAQHCIGPSLSWIYNYLCNQCLSPLYCEFEFHSLLSFIF
jgi:hypothetical protein